MGEAALPTTGYAGVDGAQLYYEVAGTGYPLVLIHAGVADLRMWDDQFALFARPYRTVRYDLRGYGRSRAAPGEFSGYEDLRGLLEYLRIERAHLVGLSWGGGVALNLALAHPELVSALVLASTTPGGYQRSEMVRRGWVEADEALERGDVQRAVEIDLQMWLDGPQRTPEQIDPQLRARVREMVAGTYGLPEVGPERPLEPPALGRLGEVRAPTLVLAGALDMPDALPAAELLAARIPGARLAIIPDAAHLVNMEYPEVFNRLVLEFLGAL